MSVHDQLSFSLCSKNTKEAIKSLNLNAELIIFVISDRDVIEFLIRVNDSVMLQSQMVHNSSPRGQKYCNAEFTTPKHVHVMSSRHNSAWIIKSIGVGSWLHHLCEVFHHARVDSLSIEYKQINVGFIEPIRRVINGLPILNLDLTESLGKEFQSKALEKFPHYEELYMKEIGLERDEVNKIVIQNLRKLYIPRSNQINLNQLLLSNCEEIKFDHLFLARKDLKKLLNLWIRGSNPKLKYFHVSWQLEIYNGVLDENIIFKDIKHTRIPLDSQEIHRRKMSDGYCEETELSGGFKIKRFDGTCAVIVIDCQTFKFIVDG
ncbi:unnamed protein product [Caenorhabditis brenneri]